MSKFLQVFYKLVVCSKRCQTFAVPEKKTVMICDDDRDSRELFGLALSPRYNVILVDSGKNCVEKFIEEKNQGSKIHLILLDYGLSDMRGATLLPTR